VSPFALYGLLATIVLLFALQGQQVANNPLAVVLIAVPLVIYFLITFVIGFFLGRAVGLTYKKTVTLAFTASGNNFELAIAVAIGTFGATSGEALAGIVGPLIEVPALLALVYLARYLQKKLF
jgi:ACR3 family arsenite transporter